MTKLETWRRLLEQIIGNAQELQRLAQAVGVNNITIARWAKGQSSPRAEHLRLLYQAVFRAHPMLAEHLKQAYPELLGGRPLAEDSENQHIPSAFYRRILTTCLECAPALRSVTMRNLIFQQMLGQFDPHELGVKINLILCVPPHPASQKVRSLRIVQGRGTPPWRSVPEPELLLSGAESLAGHCVASGHYAVVPSHEDLSYYFPTHSEPFAESMLAYPLLQGGRVAGCLSIASTQRHYFRQPQLDLARDYAYLLALSCAPEEFFDSSQIELGLMPSAAEQRPYTTTFVGRVLEQLRHAAQHSIPLSHTQAELLVLHEIEDELLLLGQRWQGLTLN
ncbi:GAF domain-containing protein [Thermogemmatispora sp.]|uniref:GAF domain-containing protein n=1 Tax=Thermogemmatispora sp. TaxID=1968838 RepID=UPI001D366EE2|nr:GAF domain-containing protein [Thermogemmatispora sp.]MBX5450376.1 GAF domain-containing protein [Thermogemmatispora sp.]